MMNSEQGLKFEENGLSPASPVKNFIRTFTQEQRIRLHYHRSFEINVCRGVNGFLRTGGNEQDLGEDCVVLIPPEIPHSYSIGRCGGTIEVSHFLIDSLPGIPEALSDFTEMIIIPLDRFRADILNMLSGFSVRERESILKISGTLLLFIDAADKIIKEYSSRIIRATGDEFLVSVVDYTEKNYSKKISLDEISSHAGMSRYHFSRSFHRKTGETWSAFLMAVRLKNSLLLLGRGVAVTEAAEISGFDSDSYYIKCFKKAYSVTPSKWSRANNSEKM